MELFANRGENGGEKLKRFVDRKGNSKTFEHEGHEGHEGWAVVVRAGRMRHGSRTAHARCYAKVLDSFVTFVSFVFQDFGF